MLLRARKSIDDGERGKRQKHCREGKEKWPKTAERMCGTEFTRDPIPDRTPENAEGGRDEERSDGREEQNQSAPLPVQKAGFFHVSVDRVNAFHDELHHLRA